MINELIQQSADGSINMSESVLVKVTGADDDPEKDVLLSWSLQVRASNDRCTSVCVCVCVCVCVSRDLFYSGGVTGAHGVFFTLNVFSVVYVLG